MKTPRTLTDVYIVATKSNVKELNLLLKKLVREGDYIDFFFDSEKSSIVSIAAPYNKQKVSLSELKRLIDTIPTREEITRLKRQISAYKTNLIVCKGDIEALRNTINQLHDDERKVLDIFSNINNENKTLNEMYDNALKEIEDIKEEKEYFRKQYRFSQSENAKLKQRKWWQIWK